MGIHHQKVVVVYGYTGITAFIGGMDIQSNRLTKPDAPAIHDVHLQVRGPAAADIARIFTQRWADHPDHSSYDNKGGLPTVPVQAPKFEVPSLLAGVAKQLCVVGRTYPNGAKHGMARSYSFAPIGEHTAWDLIAYAIQRARNYIYIEDQYLISSRVSQALADKLTSDPGFKRIIILTNPIDWQHGGLLAKELPFSQYLRARFINQLRAVDPAGRRWSIFILKESSNSAIAKQRGTYVHSKAWIFDDRYAIVGSANCDERGYTHDSECVIGVAEDDIFPAAQLGFAQKLRMRLWAKHSLVPLKKLVDWQASLRIWDSPEGGSMIQPYDSAADLASAWRGDAPPWIDQFLTLVTDPRGD